MTVPMSVVETIRALDAEGVSGRQIAQRVGVSRDSVAKYIADGDYSPTPPARVTRPGASVLTGYTAVIDEWLTEDERRPRKQRHTATRVYHRLRDESGYQGTYSPVQRYVKRFRAARRKNNEGFLELSWPAGQAQVDFGQAEAIIQGVRTRLHVLVVTFPFSNMRFCVAYRGETAECVCDGLRRIFEYIGSAPRVLVFDNATGVGRRTGERIIESKLFAAFKQHYRLTARYCTPNSGNEKGNVENAVGFLRRNLMVPEPVVGSLAELNAQLLSGCVAMGEAAHWRKGAPIGELFLEDIAAGLELPGVGFDPVRYESRRADKTGTITVEGNSYLAGPAFYGRHVTVGIRHDVIELLDEHAHPIVTFDRVYGHTPETQMQAGSLLPALALKPGAWGHSPLRNLVPDALRDWLDRARPAERGRTLAGLAHVADRTGFDTAVDAATRLIRLGDDPTGVGLEMLAYRLFQGAEPDLRPVDLTVYDRLAAAREVTA